MFCSGIRELPKYRVSSLKLEPPIHIPVRISLGDTGYSLMSFSKTASESIIRANS